MKAYHLEKVGGLNGIEFRERDIPSPGPNEVLIRVRAASLNRRDLMILNGKYPLPAVTDIVPVSDGVGEVVAVGTNVQQVVVGERIMANYFPQWIGGKLTWESMISQFGCTLDGFLAEYAVIPAGAVVHIPDHLSWEEAATLPCAALTAWSALNGPEPIQANDTVLTLGTGAVALFAVQLARALGARVISTTSTEEKAEKLRALGAEEVINYQMIPDWSKTVRSYTEGKGVNRVVDTGGSDTLLESIKSTAPNGEIALVTAIGKRPMIEIEPPVLAASLLTIRRMLVGSRTDFEEMNKTISKMGIRPVIDSVFAFTDAKKAIQYYSDGRNFGKVVIRVNE
jgi:NADPH:quinone reductase-like Zn-dependent oxidoreductase